jgi:hypothetical protein
MPDIIQAVVGKTAANQQFVTGMTVVTLGSISKESEFSRSIAIIFAEGKIEFLGDLGKVEARYTQVGHSEQSIVVSVERRVCQLELS